MTEKRPKSTLTDRQRSILRKVRNGVLMYMLVCGLAHLWYRHALYPAPIADIMPDPPGTTLLTLTAQDGVPVHALLFAGGPRTIVHFHGNGDVIGNIEPDARALVERGFSVVLVEYRGYGRSHDAGEPTEQGLYNDAEAVMAELGKRGVKEKDVVLWGQSLGSGVATEMAYRGHGSALVLITPFTSIPDVGSRIAPWLPVHWLVGDKFDTRSKAAAIRLSTMVLHGTSDRVVPFDMGKTLSTVFPNCTFKVVPGGDHNDLFAVDPSAFDALGAFASGMKPNAP